MKNNSSNNYHIFFSNLANPLKVDIISALEEKELSVGEISKNLGIEQSNLSHALADLRDCNLVTFKQKGKKRAYSLNKITLIPILKMIDRHAKEYCKRSCKFCSINT